MSVLQRDQASIHYEVDGTGPPLVLLHGMSLHGDSWRQAGYVDRLRDHHRCVLLDFRGAGQSTAPPRPAQHRLEEQVADVLGVLDHEGIDVADLWGFSFGGHVALALAAWHPERVRSVVSQGSWDVDVEEDLAMISAAQPIRERAAVSAADWLAAWEHREDPPMPEWVKEMIRGHDRDALVAMGYVQSAWPAIPTPSITCPTLIIAGELEDDDGTAPTYVEALPDGALVTVPGRNHVGAFLAVDVTLPAAEAFLHSPGVEGRGPTA